jgi:hypothetical protein
MTFDYAAYIIRWNKYKGEIVLPEEKEYTNL